MEFYIINNYIFTQYAFLMDVIFGLEDKDKNKDIHNLKS